MNSNEFIKKMHTINDIFNKTIEERENVGYIVNMQERTFDAKNGGAEIRIGVV